MNEFEKVYLNLITEQEIVDLLENNADFRKMNFRKIFNDESVFLKFLEHINCLKYYKSDSECSKLIESMVETPILDLTMDVSDEIKLLFVKRRK